MENICLLLCVITTNKNVSYFIYSMLHQMRIQIQMTIMIQRLSTISNQIDWCKTTIWTIPSSICHYSRNEHDTMKSKRKSNWLTWRAYFSMILDECYFFCASLFTCMVTWAFTQQLLQKQCVMSFGKCLTSIDAQFPSQFLLIGWKDGLFSLLHKLVVEKLFKEFFFFIVFFIFLLLFVALVLQFFSFWKLVIIFNISNMLARLDRFTYQNKYF